MAVIRDPAEKRLRALMMLEYRIKHAASLEEIAKEFNVAPKTVQKALTFARRAGLVADAEDKILQELVPAAHEALKKALASKNEEVAGKFAVEVFKGTISGFQKKPGPSPSTSTGDDLATYLERLRGDSGAVNALDGEILDSSAQRALPPAETSAPAEGIPAADFVQPPLFGDEPLNPPQVGE